MAAEHWSPVDNYVGSRMKLRRLELGLTRDNLARELSLGMQQIQKYEEGINRLTAGRLHQVSVALRVEPGWFFDGMPVEVGSDIGDAQAQEAVDMLTAENMQLVRSLVRLSPREQRAVRKLVRTLAESTEAEGAGNAPTVNDEAA